MYYHIPKSYHSAEEDSVHYSVKKFSTSHLKSRTIFFRPLHRRNRCASKYIIIVQLDTITVSCNITCTRFHGFSEEQGEKKNVTTYTLYSCIDEICYFFNAYTSTSQHHLRRLHRPPPI